MEGCSRRQARQASGQQRQECSSTPEGLGKIPGQRKRGTSHQQRLRSQPMQPETLDMVKIQQHVARAVDLLGESDKQNKC